MVDASVSVWQVFEMLGKWNCRTCWKYCLFPFNFTLQNRHWIRDPNKLEWAIFWRLIFTEFLSLESAEGIHRRRFRFAKIAIFNLCLNGAISFLFLVAFLLISWLNLIFSISSSVSITSWSLLADSVWSFLAPLNRKKCFPQIFYKKFISSIYL